MKRIISLIVAISLAYSNIARADQCSQAVTLLNLGDKAPCKGFLFSEQEESRVYLLDQNNKLLQQKVDGLQNLVISYQKSIVDFKTIVNDESKKAELWRKAAEDSTQKLIDIKNDTSRRDFWMVILGVALTVGAGYAVGQAAPHR